MAILQAPHCDLISQSCLLGVPSGSNLLGGEKSIFDGDDDFAALEKLLETLEGENDSQAESMVETSQDVCSDVAPDLTGQVWNSDMTSLLDRLCAGNTELRSEDIDDLLSSYRKSAVDHKSYYQTSKVAREQHFRKSPQFSPMLQETKTDQSILSRVEDTQDTQMSARSLLDPPLQKEGGEPAASTRITCVPEPTAQLPQDGAVMEPILVDQPAVPSPRRSIDEASALASAQACVGALVSIECTGSAELTTEKRQFLEQLASIEDQDEMRDFMKNFIVRLRHRVAGSCTTGGDGGATEVAESLVDDEEHEVDFQCDSGSVWSCHSFDSDENSYDASQGAP